MADKHWTVVTKDGEYIITALLGVKRFFSAKSTLFVRVNGQLVVEESRFLDFRLSGKYHLPLANHKAMLDVSMFPFISFLRSFRINPAYRLFVDNVEIAPGERVDLTKLAKVSSSSGPSNRSSLSVADELEKLAKLRESKLIDEAEYKAMKEKLIGRV